MDQLLTLLVRAPAAALAAARDGISIVVNEISVGTLALQLFAPSQLTVLRMRSNL